MKAIRGTNLENLGQNISLRIRIRNNNLWIRIRKKWVRIHNAAANIGTWYSTAKYGFGIVSCIENLILVHEIGIA
jgi:hypothetical protein